MKDDDPNAEISVSAPTRKTLRLPLSSLHRMLRDARCEARKAQAHVNWIKSILTERRREYSKADEPRGDE